MIKHVHNSISGCCLSATAFMVVIELPTMIVAGMTWIGIAAYKGTDPRI